jgi:hypothetical protein
MAVAYDIVVDPRVEREIELGEVWQSGEEVAARDASVEGEVERRQRTAHGVQRAAARVAHACLREAQLVQQQSTRRR